MLPPGGGKTVYILWYKKLKIEHQIYWARTLGRKVELASPRLSAQTPRVGYLLRVQTNKLGEASRLKPRRFLLSNLVRFLSQQ
jgi:hypothetical protein